MIRHTHVFSMIGLLSLVLVACAVQRDDSQPTTSETAAALTTAAVDAPPTPLCSVSTT